MPPKRGDTLQRRRTRHSRTALVVAVLAISVLAAFSTSGAMGAGAALEAPNVDVGSIPAPLGAQDGTLNIVVGLVDPPVAVAARQQNLTAEQQRQYESQLEAKQDTVSSQAQNIGASELASVTTALNAIIVRAEASKIDELEALPGVNSVRPVADYQLDLSETVEHIGAAALHASGIDGTGIEVSVIDSGIDYTHENFGGAGTLEAYTAAYGTTTSDPRTTTRDGLFPTEKVIAGWDFVGEVWPNGDLAPDPDPIDCGPQVIPLPCAGGHGTHVGDIIAGEGPVVGVAPGAKLMAFKACSAVSSSCSGVALLEAVDASLDPDGNGDIADRADVINLSLGSSYGQVEDDLSFALENAVDAGVVVVASAGNSADLPYVVGSPSSSPGIISVAQTQVPSAKLYLLDPAAAGFRSVGAVHQEWSAPPTAVTGTLEYNTGSLGKKRGCDDANGANPYSPGEHTGDILFVDRGLCSVSLKATNAAAAGAIAVIVGNHTLQAPGDLPPSFSYGGGEQTIAAYTITLRDANHLRGVPETTPCPGTVCPNPGTPNAFGQPATIDPASAVSLVGNMVASSSRGPNYSFNAIKPDLGAPGGSVSSEAGTGTDETAFGGTSGAAPMVAGSAALLLDKSPNLSVTEVKTLLMNTAETNIGLNPVGLPGVLAPITRIGAGEVRVNRAAASGTAAWETQGNGASLSFGYHPIATRAELRRSVTVKNYSDAAKTYTITASFRYASDAGGAVTIETPQTIRVAGGATETFNVGLTIDPSKLPVWDLNGGSRGGDGYRLQGVEYDGYITLNGGENDTVHLAWHVLPHRSARVDAPETFAFPNGSTTSSVELKNTSRVLDGRVDVFSLTGKSPRIAKRFQPRPGDNFAIVDLRAVGVRQLGDNVQFGIDTFGARAHPNYPAEFDVYIDSNRDGSPDYILFTVENGGFAATGQNVTAVFNVATGAISVYFFTDADLNSGNVIMTAPMAAVGLTPSTQFDFSVYVFDNYFTGALTDAIEDMTYTLGTPRFSAPLEVTVPADGRLQLQITAVPGGEEASPSQTGLLLLYRDAGRSGGNDASRNEADVIELRGRR